MKVKIGQSIIKAQKVKYSQSQDKDERGMFMLCQNCQQRKAHINFRLVLNGQETQLHLCQTCYQTQKQNLTTHLGPSMNLGGFGEMHSSPMDDLLKQLNHQQGMNLKASNQQAQAHHEGFLDQFGRNLNGMAKAGLIDPVIGRDEEIQE